MDDPPPYCLLWPIEDQPIPNKADAALPSYYSSPTNSITIKAACVFHLTRPAYTDSKGRHHPFKICKVKQSTIEFRPETTLDQFVLLAHQTCEDLFSCRGCMPRKLLRRPCPNNPRKQLELDMTLATGHESWTGWTQATWAAAIETAIEAAIAVAGAYGSPTPVLKKRTWWVKARPQMTAEEAGRVSSFAKLACLAKGHRFWLPACPE